MLHQWPPGPFEDAAAAYQRRDYATFLRLIRPLADQGDAKAQFALGSMYVLGRGVPEDYAEALKWLRLAANQGLADAQNSLGGMYREGQGVPQDDAEAVKWYRLAANQGNASAQNSLGTIECAARWCVAMLCPGGALKEPEAVMVELAEYAAPVILLTVVFVLASTRPAR